jgi:hypothetical protein
MGAGHGGLRLSMKAYLARSVSKRQSICCRQEDRASSEKLLDVGTDVLFPVQASLYVEEAFV